MSYDNLAPFNRPGLQSVGQYQLPGRSWITGSTLGGGNPNNGEILIQFPQVTKAFSVLNLSSNAIYVHFDSRANSNVISHKHYVPLTGSVTFFDFNTKNKQIFISMENSLLSGSFSLHAELTGLDPINMYPLTGSGIND